VTILLTSSQNLESGSFNDLLGGLSESFGIPGFPQSGVTRKTTQDAISIGNKLNDVFNKLLGKSENRFDTNYVESGKKIIVGSGIGDMIPLEEGNAREIHNQTPTASILIKKRAFSSLQNLYDPTFMDPAEKWLLRATKRLVSKKCEVMADYERLSKIDKLLDSGVSPAAVVSSLITSANAEIEEDTAFNSSMEFEQIIGLRQPVTRTTYFVDTTLPLMNELGIGSGVFEITLISTINTSLGLDGSSSCSFSIEDPYRILFISEEDIENALRDTVLAPLVNSLDSAAGNALSDSQISDELLSKSRIYRNVSEITFSISLGNSKVSAVLDAIGFEINPNNIDDVPEPHSLSDGERTLFLATYAGLQLYQQSMSKTILNGFNLGTAKKEISEQMEYARKKMRLFYLGKSVIQPMDTINIFMDGRTRKLGEAESIDNLNESKIIDLFDLGTNRLGIDDGLLRQEYDKLGENRSLTFEDYKRLRTISFSTENATHVFGGLITRVEDKFDANSGSYVLNVSGESNMHWLSVSRYNSQPSLTQMQGLVYDPLTPFKFELDSATGLPTGEPKLLEINRQIVNKITKNGKARLYFDSGPKIGKEFKGTEDDLKQDIKRIGGNLVFLYEHVPGLVYRWKEGIMTTTYNQYVTNPLDGTTTNLGQFKREVGLHAVNTPFDGMDAANVLSVLITGKPYNYSTFIQSAINSTTFNPDITLNSGRDYFQSLIRNLQSEIRVNGNFVPFKIIEVSSQELATSIALQRQLSGKSKRLEQLRNEQAKLFDKVGNYPGGIDDSNLKDAFNIKNNKLEAEINQLEIGLNSLTKEGSQLSTNTIRVAGDDISFDLQDLSTEENFKLFGDRLIHATQRLREDVIRNIDKNYFIISDEYDKDYDIQAFVLKLAQQQYNLWKGSWQPIIQLCKTVAETLNFELFCNSQGHIVFRPPQYNRTPASVLDQMFSLNNSGVRIFPEFLTSLFVSKEKALTNEVIILEWEIRKQAALLGKKTVKEVEQLIYGKTGNVTLFITNQVDMIDKSANLTRAEFENARNELLGIVEQSNYQTQLKFTGGAFSPIAQRNLQKEFIYDLEGASESSDKNAYDEACKAIANLSGFQRRSQGEFDKEKIGAKVNGQSNPASDVNRIISNISSLVSKRTKLIISLQKNLQQNIEISCLSENGQPTIKRANVFNVSNLPAELSNRLIENDSANLLGHLSGDRFVIKDSQIIDASFTEKPPEITNISVKGSLPIVGGQGDIAGVPELTALSTDFDMWRQYGWRDDKPVDKPFFSDAQLQCAPYAVMLLSRQRKNIVTGSVTLFGNEYYQLGDVVYVAHRQLLYYVNRVQHTFSYSGEFRTTLELVYGHPPGEYIPTPLDIIGKQMVNRSNSHSAYRIRREIPRNNSLLGAVVFDEDSTDLLKGNNARRNFNQLVNAVSVAKAEMNENDILNSSRIYCMTFFGDSSLQNQRAGEVAKWFDNPEKPATSPNTIGKGTFTGSLKGEGNLQGFKVNPKLVKIKRVNQNLPEDGTLTPAELDLLSQGITASQEAIALDPGLGNVVEIRLVQPPSGGWPHE